MQDLVFFGEARPVLVRLHVRIDGKPLQAAWDQFVRAVFQSLDADKDGILSREEAEKMPPPQVLFAGNSFFNGTPPAFDQIDANRDGKVTVEELGAFYRRNGGAPFQVSGGSAAAQPVRFNPSNMPPSADALNEALFKLLDTDKDGKLSKDELAKAPASLMHKDEDDDEIIVPSELAAGPNPFEAERLAVALQTEAMRGRGAVPTFRTINPGDSPTELVRQLQARYAPKGPAPSRKLTRKDIGLDEVAFGQLDADGDGELDSEELARFARRPVDIELTVALSTAADKPAALEIVAGEGRPLTANLRKTKEGGVVLDLGTTRVDLRVGGAGGAMVGVAPNVRETFKRQFTAADQDNNGYLEPNEVRQNRFFSALFKLMDADGDGKLYEKEMLAYVERTEGLQAQAMAACTGLAVSDQGRGLFDLIDSNRDGRLSVREMRNAAGLAQSLDRDSDGKVGKDEVPRSYQVNLSRGPANFSPFGGRVVVAAPSGMRGPGVPEPTAGPLWFRKMDLNRDGFVSRREFLGTDQQFKAIDTDADVLIDQDEADRYDSPLRKEKESKR